MQIKFWGTRGSLPYGIQASQIESKIRQSLELFVKSEFYTSKDYNAFINKELPFAIKGAFGTNTPCLQILGGNEYILCDAGSGIRDFSNFIKASAIHPPQTFHIFISHLHWDHIQGFPFFTPAIKAGNKIHIYGFHENMEEAFAQQQKAPFFPLPLHKMKSDIIFHQLKTDQTYQVAGIEVCGIEQCHPGKSFSYCFQKDGKKLVYSSDAEHTLDDTQKGSDFLNFVEGSDVLIFDAQYNISENIGKKKNWGHSNNLYAVDVALNAGVKKLCLFHNDEKSDDFKLEGMLKETIQYYRAIDTKKKLEIMMAYDGLLIDV